MSSAAVVWAMHGENGALYQLHASGNTVRRQLGKVTTFICGWRGMPFDSRDAAVVWAEMDARTVKRDSEAFLASVVAFRRAARLLKEMWYGVARSAYQQPHIRGSARISGARFSAAGRAMLLKEVRGERAYFK